MPPTNPTLDQVADDLARSGGDPQRVQLVECARRFKRSWLEMAKALAEVRHTRAYEDWGYPDLHTYCRKELMIRPATVDKLTLSYSTVRKYAPEVLERDGVHRSIPSVDAVDYFARALEKQPANDGKNAAAGPPSEVIDHLRQAVFDESLPLGALKKKFRPLLSAPSGETDSRASVDKTRLAIKRVLALLPEVQGLSNRRRQSAETALAGLLDELERLGEMQSTKAG